MKLYPNYAAQFPKPPRPTDHLETNVFVRSSQSTPIYKGPGGKLVRIAKPDSYIGRIVGFNMHKTWAKLGDGNWIVYNPSAFTFHEPVPTPDLSIDQKIDVALSVAKQIPGTQVGAEVLDATKEVGEKVVSLLPNIKVILVIVALVVIALIVIKFK